MLTSEPISVRLHLSSELCPMTGGLSFLTPEEKMQESEVYRITKHDKILGDWSLPASPTLNSTTTVYVQLLYHPKRRMVPSAAMTELKGIKPLSIVF